MSDRQFLVEEDFLIVREDPKNKIKRELLATEEIGSGSSESKKILTKF